MRILQSGDPGLRKVSQVIDKKEIEADSVQGLIAHMQTILNGIKAISDENGNALSAPQVGNSVRLVVLRIDGEFVVMINPELEPTSDQKFAFQEECFSLYHLRATVQRHYAVKVDYLDHAGEKQTRHLTGEEAGLVQHEVDHLNGILFTDLIDEVQVSTIDEQYQNEPQRLQQLKAMMAYMRGED